MVINIFEVARRFSKLVATIWIIGWIIKALNEGMQGDPITFASVAFGGLLFILAFTWIIGWVVRGFKGIPKGQDQKE
jgi:hypothetical protein